MVPNTEDQVTFGAWGWLLMISDIDHIFLFPSGGKPTGATLHGLAPKKVFI